MWEKFKYPILAFCIPVNVILGIFGIFTDNGTAVALALTSLFMFVIPLLGDFYAEEVEDINKKQED
jgi:hypothetical protein